MKKIIYISFFAAATLFSACDDLFEPAIENQRDIQAMEEEPTYAEGFLLTAYNMMPYASPYTASVGSDYATDDVVSAVRTNNYSRMATGSWAANNSPVSRWQNGFSAIQYINIVLEKADKVKWAASEALCQMFADRVKGEAYAQRALQHYYLLRAHAGYDANGQLLGIPLHTEYENASADFNRPRDTFQDCVKQILEDLDAAESLLAYVDGDIASEDEVPAKYKAIGGTMGDYNRAFGSHHFGKINGKVVSALRAQLLLLAASPAYSAASGYTYSDAADAAAKVLDKIGGVAGMDANGWRWFANASQIDGLGRADDPAEILWRSPLASRNDYEKAYYPPSLYGNGMANPTQNLVDAFPMANGYPITDAASGYDANDPYTGRDPRLTAYILVNGSTQGVDGATITTGTYGTNRDALNRENGVSTRTGYYMRKFLRSDVNLNPSSSTTQLHYMARIRYTELFLDYAEAANEAYGPTTNGGHGYSAYDVIKALRHRAGVGGTDDPYLESIKNDQAKMRELIRNERRLELCFEDHRFYDLRRWKVDLDVLNAPAKGMQIDKDEQTGNLSYTVLPSVETRDYKDYMYYCPIPYSEVVKWSELQQNQGW